VVAELQFFDNRLLQISNRSMGAQTFNFAFEFFSQMGNFYHQILYFEDRTFPQEQRSKL